MKASLGKGLERQHMRLEKNTSMNCWTDVYYKAHPKLYLELNSLTADCRLHDMVREMVIKIAREENFMSLDDEGRPSVCSHDNDNLKTAFIRSNKLVK